MLPWPLSPPSWRDSIVIPFIAMSSSAIITAVGCFVGRRRPVDNDDPLLSPPPAGVALDHPEDGINLPMLGCVGGMMYSSIVQMG